MNGREFLLIKLMRLIHGTIINAAEFGTDTHLRADYRAALDLKRASEHGIPFVLHLFEVDGWELLKLLRDGLWPILFADVKRIAKRNYVVNAGNPALMTLVPTGPEDMGGLERAARLDVFDPLAFERRGKEASSASVKGVERIAEELGFKREERMHTHDFKDFGVVARLLSHYERFPWEREYPTRRIHDGSGPTLELVRVVNTRPGLWTRISLLAPLEVEAFRGRVRVWIGRRNLYEARLWCFAHEVLRRKGGVISGPSEWKHFLALANRSQGGYALLGIAGRSVSRRINVEGDIDDLREELEPLIREAVDDARATASERWVSIPERNSLEAIGLVMMTEGLNKERLLQDLHVELRELVANRWLSDLEGDPEEAMRRAYLEFVDIGPAHGEQHEEIANAWAFAMIIPRREDIRQALLPGLTNADSSSLLDEVRGYLSAIADHGAPIRGTVAWLDSL